MKKVVPFVVGLLAYFAVGYFFGGDKLKDFEPFESPEGRFTVSMPGQPEKETKSIPTDSGSMNLTVYSAGSNETQFAVLYFDIPQERVANSDPQEMLDVAKAGLVSDSEGQLQSENKLGIYDSPAKEVNIKVEGKGNITARLILKGNRLYQVMAMLPDSGRHLDKVPVFFDSFKMN